MPQGKPIFPLPHDKDAAMVKVDLDACGIPYEDASGQFFDFHSLRCELATLAEAAGMSPRVVQKLMRHSKPEMTGRYTRPAPWISIPTRACSRRSSRPGTGPILWP
jgi:integrase